MVKKVTERQRDKVPEHLSSIIPKSFSKHKGTEAQSWIRSEKKDQRISE